MQKNSGIARLVCVFTVCIALIGYNTYSYCFKGATVDNTFEEAAVYEETPARQEEPSEITESEEASSAQKSTESAAATDSGDAL